MTTEQTDSYLQALLASVTISVIIPLLMFAILTVALWWLLALAQKKPGFNIEEIFLDDETRRVTPWRVVSLGAFVWSVWYLATDRLSAAPNPQVFRDFLIFWSGTPVAVILANKWDGRLPFAKGPE